MDAHLTNEDLREQSKLEFYWTFVGTKDQPKEPTKPTEPTTPTQTSEPTIPSSPGGSGNLPSTGQGIPSNRKLLPQTGEQIVYMFLSGLLLVMITLFLWKKRQEEEQE